MNKKIKIKTVSAWSIGITIAFAFLFIIVCTQSEKEFRTLRITTDQYITCEKAAKQLQDGSDYLSEQARLYAMTGQTEYRDLYFEEANETQRREKALEDLKEYFNNTDVFDSLKKALSASEELMNTEYYSMRLVCEASLTDSDTWPEEIQSIRLSGADSRLSSEAKYKKAQKLLSSDQYQKVRNEITNDVTECMNELIAKTQDRQGRATTIFTDMYRKLVFGIVVLVVLMFTICLMVRHLIVKPLISYNESIKKGIIFPVIGSAELQNLAETYNRVYEENQETQKLIRHQAEHDALTGLLNRGSFERITRVYENGDVPFAMILVDVDIFKSVNDTYGHAAGDAVLKKVSSLLRGAFRSIDYVCRIGGDEFAVIMVEMTSDLGYTISEKIKYINEELSVPEEGVPAVSLSVGVAFSDRPNPGESIFKDADKSLYEVKEHGRNGCAFYDGTQKSMDSHN